MQSLVRLRELLERGSKGAEEASSEGTSHRGDNGAAKDSSSGGDGGVALSLRQQLRLGTQISHTPADAHALVMRCVAAPFMPQPVREQFVTLLHDVGFEKQHAVVPPLNAHNRPLRSLDTSAPEAATSTPPPSAPDLAVSVSESEVRIGEVALARARPKAPELVPDVLFYDSPAHTRLLQVGAGRLLVSLVVLLCCRPQRSCVRALACRT